MTGILNKMVKNYKKYFWVDGTDKAGSTFVQELNSESGKLFITVFIALVVWLPYISFDMNIHQYPILAISFRLGASLLSFSLILLRFSKPFRQNPNILLKILAAYFYIATAIVASTSGEFASSYIGGYTFIIMMMIIGPFSFRFKAFFTIFSFILFIVAGYFTGLGYWNEHNQYSINDVLVAVITSLILNYIINGMRYVKWKQRRELEDMVLQNERNIKTISDLAYKAEKANSAKSNFLAVMSHEIRTPMNAILGAAQIQLQKEELPEEYASALEIINNSGNNLLAIINDILDMSKIETGKMDIINAEYDISSLINDTVQLNIVRIASKPIEFQLKINDDIPSRFFGDELRIKQILNNLLSNAIKYTDKGKVKLTVDYIQNIDTDEFLQFTIEDTGQGIKQNDLNKLFSEFERFNKEVNRATEGTGIGLSITKNLTDMMNGTIEVKSEYGKGSLFTVTLPQMSVSKKTLEKNVIKNLENFVFSGKKDKRIIIREIMPYGKVLVVDDVDTNLYVMKGLLSPYQIQTETANSGYETINKVENGSTYDIIFMDHMMPQMDGIETTKKLRAMGYDGLIIALTANALSGNDVMFKENGFDDFISKPIDVRRLNMILTKYIRDRNPLEAKKYKKGLNKTILTSSHLIDEKLIKIFCKDAEKAIETLRETKENGNLKLFGTTVHAMKSALDNIGMNDKSKFAYALESAAANNDINFISINTERFIKMLETLINTLKSPESEKTDDIYTQDDSSYLMEQLSLVKTACDDYDDTAIYTILERLKENRWCYKTTDMLDKLYDMLFLHSDFDGITEAVEAHKY